MRTQHDDGSVGFARWECQHEDSSIGNFGIAVSEWQQSRSGIGIWQQWDGSPSLKGMKTDAWRWKSQDGSLTTAA